MDDRDGRLVVQVADSGIGIDKEMLPRLFSAFEQGERAVTRRYGGLGLGLSISKALIEMHRGTLVASSEGPGRGARFTLSLSTVATPATAPPAIALGEDSTREMSRILLVEDHEDTRRIMCQLLRSWGHTVTAASSVNSALELAECQEFDLLISDLGLPDGSGMDLIRQLLPKHAIKAIALSGYGMEQDMAQTKAAGFLAHLTKPVDLQKLEEVVRQVLLRPVA
jgi:two-component system CheB/CheR fusion protein